MKKEERITIVTDEVTKFLLSERAKVRRMSLTSFLVEGGLLLGGLDMAFLQEMEKTSREVGVKVALLIQNLVINQIAMSGSFQKIFGKPSKTMARVFRFEGGKLMTGDELLSELNQEYESMFEKWADNLIEMQEHGTEFRVSSDQVEALRSQL